MEEGSLSTFHIQMERRLGFKKPSFKNVGEKGGEFGRLGDLCNKCNKA